MGSQPYPDRGPARDDWILSRRPERNRLDPRRPHAFLLEEERAGSGEVVEVATIFLTNRECPWRCLMCDLWKNTLTKPVARGEVPAQIEWALSEERNVELEASSGASSRGSSRGFSRARQVKLYNSGSFFDSRAIPPDDHAAIASLVRPFERVIVESHPALVGEMALRFRDLLAGELEVAMGLETAHPEVLEKLNKRMTLEQFSRAAAFLQKHGIALRVFVLVKPPFLDEAGALFWANRSIDFAFARGASACSLIPTRSGNGALEALLEQGQFSPPRLSTLEAAAAYGIELKRGRVFADLWDLEELSDCAACFPARCRRLREMNLRQVVAAPVACPDCGEVPPGGRA